MGPSKIKMTKPGPVKLDPSISLCGGECVTQEPNLAAYVNTSCFGVEKASAVHPGSAPDAGGAETFSINSCCLPYFFGLPVNTPQNRRLLASPSLYLSFPNGRYWALPLSIGPPFSPHAGCWIIPMVPAVLSLYVDKPFVQLIKHYHSIK